MRWENTLMTFEWNNVDVNCTIATVLLLLITFEWVEQISIRISKAWLELIKSTRILFASDILYPLRKEFIISSIYKRV